MLLSVCVCVCVWRQALCCRFTDSHPAPSPCPHLFLKSCSETCSVAHPHPAGGEPLLRQRQHLIPAIVSSEGPPWRALGYCYPTVEHRDSIVPVSLLSASNRFQPVPVTQHKSPELQYGLRITHTQNHCDKLP